ncbi:MAG: TIM barrel protein [Saprospiraceae bacterium]
MEPLLHTIALEPERWKPARVSRPLIELLPAIQELGLSDLEVYEPHLLLAPSGTQLQKALQEYELNPVILSSYLDLNPAITSDAELERKITQLVGLIAQYSFRRVRLFAGIRMSPDDVEGAGIFAARLSTLAARMPEVEFLVETHDLSLADNPAFIFKLINDLGRSNVKLLFQPTLFKREAASAQFHLQQSLVHHLHLQNRDADGHFVSLAEGLVDWREILTSSGPEVSCAIEFVPAGICSLESFDQEVVLAEIRAEAEFIRSLFL